MRYESFCRYRPTFFKIALTPSLKLTDFIVKYNIGLKYFLQQGISEPIFHGDLVYKFKRIVGKPNLNDQFKKTVKCCKKKVG